jgi:paraquat-inducible protein B
MSQQANKTLIGGFVVGALALVVVGVLIFGSGKLFKSTNTYILFFDGSVKGLNVGAPVLFSGVKIGSVKDIKLQADMLDKTIRTPVIIEIQPARFEVIRGEPDPDPRKNIEQLIESGLSAQLQTQSLITGQLMIELDLRPETRIKLLGNIGHGYVEIPTIPSTLETLTKTIQDLKLEELVQKLASTVAGLEKLINSKEVSESFAILNETIMDTQRLIQNTDRRMGTLAAGLDETVSDAQKLVRRIDGQVVPLASNINKTLGDAQQVLGNVDSQMIALAESVNKTAEKAIETLVATEALLKKDSPVVYQMTKTLKELSDAARSIRLWAEYLERHPEALLRGKK